MNKNGNCLQPPACYFQLLFPFQMQQTAVRQTMEGVFFVVVLSCDARILLVTSVFRLVDRAHTKQPICQLLPQCRRCHMLGGLDRTHLALASAADELVLAVKTLSPEGHLSPNAASQRTPALDLFLSCAKKKVCWCQKDKASFPLCPYWQPKSQWNYDTVIKMAKLSLISKNFSLDTHSRILSEIISL